MHLEHKNLLGIGIGPSNLGLAALLHPLSSLSRAFFDEKPQFEWHGGLLLPGSQLQVHYLKDLVSLVDPSNSFSFLSFLRRKKRLYQFINAQFNQVSREEFNAYYQWVAGQLPHLHFNKRVREVLLKENQLQIQFDNNAISCDHLVIGCGKSPSIPAFARNKMSNSLFHASEFKNRALSAKNKEIVVVGGGQTSAEIMSFYLDQPSPPKCLTWLSRRDNFLPLDNSPFVNELFTPAYSNYFYSLPEKKRLALVKKQKLFSDGISQNLLKSLYQKMYRLKYLHDRKDSCRLLPGFDLVDIFKRENQWCLKLKNNEVQEIKTVFADIVILCTGYEETLPQCIQSLSDHFVKTSGGQRLLNKDYSLEWTKTCQTRLYLQNAALNNRGIADPNLSLAAWRNATIINSILRKTVYDVSDYNGLFSWTQKANHHYPSSEHASLLNLAI